MKILSIDTETTGLSSDCAAFQLGAVYYDTETGEIERLNEFWNPSVVSHYPATGPRERRVFFEDQAATIHGYSDEKIRSFPRMKVDYIANFLERKTAAGAVVIAQNSHFDVYFLRESIARHSHGKHDWTPFRVLDVPSYAKPLYDAGKLPGLSLKSLSQFYRIKIGAHHDALNDAEVLLKIFIELRKTYEDLL